MNYTFDTYGYIFTFITAVLFLFKNSLKIIKYSDISMIRNYLLLKHKEL